MDPALYKAAKEGNTGVLRLYTDRLGHQLTPRKNTVLHVAAQFQDDRECVEQMLIQEPSLLRQVNSKGETALHIAARRGSFVTVQELLAFAKNQADPESDVSVTKELLRMATLEEKDTALHEAVRNNHLRVVNLLLEEDPDLSYATANSDGETPLYLAAERHYHEIVSAILGGTCRNQAYGGPNGRTALHAAVIANCSDCVNNLLKKNQDLIKKGDSYGWTPLHFAARFKLAELTKQLLDTDKSIAYLPANEDDKMTALHLAAKWQSFKTMQELWLYCPDCWEMVNKRGQNVLHIAIENKNSGLIKKILNSTIPVSNLLNEKDEDGNTPLHLLGIFNCTILELIRHSEVDKGAFNKKHQTPLEAMVDATFNEEIINELLKENAPWGRRNIVSDDGKNRTDMLEKIDNRITNDKKEKDDENSRLIGTVILVATLVATVTFAASFTVPGGFDSNQGPNQGVAILVRNAAFKAFVISNTIAVTFSISAVILLLFSSYYEVLKHIQLTKCNWLYKAANRIGWAINCLYVSLAAMMVSLITGSFAVLSTSMGLAVAVCAIGCVGILIFCVLLYKYSVDIFYMISQAVTIRRLIRLYEKNI